VAQAARQAGMLVRTIRTPLTGDVRTVARVIGAVLLRKDFSNRARTRPRCFIAGGEPTVTVSGRGLGGRAQHCALLCASWLEGRKDIWLASFGTDGIDGPTEAAGAVVNGDTIARARELGVSARVALRRYDAYSFFRRVGGHLLTGPTGTNVNDLYIGLAL
jgi:hydroxypyruvate reductase